MMLLRCPITPIGPGCACRQRLDGRDAHHVWLGSSGGAATTRLETAAAASGHPAPQRRGQSRTTRSSAEVLPFRPGTSSYCTFWPSRSVRRPARSTAEMWTNASLEPSLGWMNPYPLVGLNHFTVPVGMAAPCHDGYW